MHICKRILQVCEDLGVFFGIGTAAGQISGGIAAIAAGATPVGIGMIIGTIVGFVVGFIINRSLRFLYDTVEFNAISSDAKDIVADLRRQARNTDSNKLSDKLNKEADRLEEAIKKYS